MNYAMVALTQNNREERMIVLKFGGTSVQNCECMDRAIDITDGQIDRAPLVISSAMSKVTDTLVDITMDADKGDKEGALAKVEEIALRHNETAREFLTGKNLENALVRLEAFFSEMRAFVTGLTMLRECSPRSSDAIVSFGELLSTTLLYFRCLERNIQADFVDSRDLVVTDDNFISASPYIDKTYKNIRKNVHPKKGKIIIAQGFIGRTETGVVSTLGRGGSDYSATLFGAALKAEEVQIWTDVDGIMTSDPRIVESAQTIPTISYEEAAELAYFGAKVVHPSTIQPAVALGISVLVKNTMNTKGNYTAIVTSSDKKGLRAIAGKKNITLLNITSSRMLNAYGFLSRIFAIFAQYKTPVDLIATSEVSVSMTIDSTTALDEIQKDLTELGKVTVEHEKSIICLVGQEFWKDSVFTSRVFSALNDIPIRMISLGASDINLSLVVPQEMMHNSIERLHREFF